MIIKLEKSNALVDEILKASLDKIGSLVAKKAKLLLEGHVGRPTKLSNSIQYRVEGRDVVIYSDNKILTFIEKGTQPHEIRPKKPGGALAFRANSGGVRKNQTKYEMGDTIITKVVHHPGTDAKPVLSAALFLSKPEILKELKKTFKSPTLVSKGSN